MENKKEIIKKTRFFISLRKEKLWLEEMAEQGYFFKNITWGGIHYTFETGKPKKMVYEIDRFNLPKNPTLSQIHEKDEFLSLAQELNWREVTHDVDMNYYFEKEYEENGINELYNDQEMRAVHANKYYEHFMQQPMFLDKIALLLGILFLCLRLFVDHDSNFTLYFGLIYALYTISFHLSMGYFARLYQKELSIPIEEWYHQEKKKKSLKAVTRFFVSGKQLEKYLHAQSKKGWHIQKINAFRYYFQKGTPETRHYMVDSHVSVNSRRKNQHLSVLRDGKDITMQNNDWQYQSVSDAESRNWNFLCAFGNLFIVYFRDTPPDETMTLPTKFFCLHPWAAFFIICSAVGYIAGFVFAVLL